MIGFVKKSIRKTDYRAFLARKTSGPKLPFLARKVQ